jgi:hypothetical protein
MPEITATMRRSESFRFKDSPGKKLVTSHLNKRSQAWWHTPVIFATWERLEDHSPGYLRQKVRPSLKNDLKVKKP